jgi:hypothetical protein
MIRIELDDDEEDALRTFRSSFSAIRPHLVGAIADDADRALAKDGEART